MKEESRFNCKGFLLLESLVYIFLLLFLTMYLVDWLSRNYEILARHSGQAGKLIALTSAHDVIMRDLREAERESFVAYSDKVSYFWKVQGHDICWELKKKRLVRSYGDCDVGNVVWKTRKKSIIADNIDFLEIIYDQFTQTVTCVMSAQLHDCMYNQKRLSRMRNRALS